MDGVLRSRRAMPESFEPSDLRLRSVQLEIFHGLLFISLGDTPEPFDARALDGPMAAFYLANAQVAAERSYTVGANWKLAIENYHECYHCVTAHPEYSRIHSWHKDAVARALRAGFDIIYVYAGHGYMPAQFLSPVFNQRADEYGRSFENRARLTKELLLDAHDVVAGQAAVALRFAVDNLDEVAGITCTGDGRALVEHLADIPDLWDVNVANFAGGRARVVVAWLRRQVGRAESGGGGVSRPRRRCRACRHGFGCGITALTTCTERQTSRFTSIAK